MIPGAGKSAFRQIRSDQIRAGPFQSQYRQRRPMKFPITRAWSLLSLLCLTFLTGPVTLKAGAPNYLFKTLAGVPDIDGTGPFGLAIDAEGNLYACDFCGVQRYSTNGVITSLAGSTLGRMGKWDGQGTGALFNFPKNLAMDAGGLLYVADFSNQLIRVVDGAGRVSTMTFSPDSDYPQLPNSPQLLACTRDGTLYLTLQYLTGVFRVDAQRRFQAVQATLEGDGTPVVFTHPGGLAVDDEGNLYVADVLEVEYSPSIPVIYKITPRGKATVVFKGQTTAAGGLAISGASGLALDGNDTLYVSCASQQIIFKVLLKPSPTLILLAGQPNLSGRQDGPVATGTLAEPGALVVGQQHQLYVNTTGGIRQIADGVISTVFGPGRNVGSRDGQGSEARFNHPSGLAVDASRNVFVADTLNHTIRKIDPMGRVSTLAGMAGVSGLADGTGSEALFSKPACLAVDSRGYVYVADTGNNEIRRITPEGVVIGYSGLAGVTALAVGPDDSLYAGDEERKAIRKYAPDGSLSIININSPWYGLHALAVARDGGFYIINDDTYEVYDYLAGVRGTYFENFGRQMVVLTSLTTDTRGGLSLTDSDLDSIRRWLPDVGGSMMGGGVGFGGGLADGVGRYAQFRNPTGIAVDNQGTLYVADTDNSTIRIGTPYLGATILSDPVGTNNITAGYDYTFNVSVSGYAAVLLPVAVQQHQPPRGHQCRPDPAGDHPQRCGGLRGAGRECARLRFQRQPGAPERADTVADSVFPRWDNSQGRRRFKTGVYSGHRRCNAAVLSVVVQRRSPRWSDQLFSDAAASHAVPGGQLCVGRVHSLRHHHQCAAGQPHGVRQSHEASGVYQSVCISGR